MLPGFKCHVHDITSLRVIVGSHVSLLCFLVAAAHCALVRLLGWTRGLLRVRGAL